MFKLIQEMYVLLVSKFGKVINDDGYILIWATEIYPEDYLDSLPHCEVSFSVCYCLLVCALLIL